MIAFAIICRVSDILRMRINCPAGVKTRWGKIHQVGTCETVNVLGLTCISYNSSYNSIFLY